MERHATHVHTFAQPHHRGHNPSPIPPPVYGREEEGTLLHLRPRARIARPMTWEDIVQERAARGLATLDSPAPAQLERPPSRGPSPTRGPKREAWQRGTWQPNAFAEWERERRVGKAVKSMADLLSRPEWKGASVVGEAPHPMIATYRADAQRARARAEEYRRKAGEHRDAATHHTARTFEVGTTDKERARAAQQAKEQARLANLRLQDEQEASREARTHADAADRLEKEGAVYVVLRHPSGATVTLDPSKV